MTQDPTPSSEPPAPPLERRLHTAFGGIPYYDAELDVPQSKAHQRMVFEVGSVLEVIASEAGLTFLSDHPTWYLHPETDEQKPYFGDCVIAVGSEARITAEDLRVVIEVVTTTDRRKEVKDTGFQRVLNEYNRVPEFGLLFPEVDDARSLEWYRLVDGRYQAVNVAPGGAVAVQGVPGLELRVRPKADWSPGGKVDVIYDGELRQPLARERARANQERDRAERLAAQLRALGVEPDE